MNENIKINNEKDFKFYIKSGAVFLVFTAMALFAFFCFVQRDVDKNVKKTLMDNVERQNHHLQTILDLQFQHLESVAESLAHGGELTSEENMHMIQVLQKNSDFERASIIDAEGNSHYDEGSVKNVSHRRYFKEGIAGNRTLSDPLESSIDGQTRVVVGVPIYTEEGMDREVAGILAVSYDMTALSRMMFEDIYGGEGFSMILTREGDVISYDVKSTAADSSLQSIGKSVFEKYEAKLPENQTLETVIGDFRIGKSGCVELKNGTKDWYMAYAPLSYNGWIVCYSIPSKSARSDYQFINRYEMVLCLVLASAALVLILIVMRRIKNRQNMLMEYANTDALTGLCNKEKTKDEIEQWLMEPEKHKGIQAFIIMDVDCFKDVNDTYGHLAGDLVLQKTGRFLRNQFRGGDILGRIGGDEFVVFMKNVDSADHVQAKVRELTQKIHELQIPELKGKTLSVSLGVSYAPDHGKTYLELYNHADEALYETKRNGKNGYTVYSAGGTEDTFME